MVFSDSITRIGSNSFSNCINLTEVIIPDSVTCINYGAFYNCIGLTKVIIPDSVNSIGDYAFYGCIGLTSAVIVNLDMKEYIILSRESHNVRCNIFPEHTKIL